MALAGDHVKVLVGGYELTSDSQRIDINDQRAMHETTVLGDSAHNFIPGLKTASIGHTGYVTAAANRSHPVLKGASLQGAVSILVGQNATPATGDPVYSLYTQQGKYNTFAQVGSYIPFQAQFANSASNGGWGELLTPPITFTNAQSGTVVNNGAASSDGGVVFLHLLQTAMVDRYTFTVEGSTTGAFAGEQTTLTTFSLDASTLGSDYKVVMGVIPQYVRWKATRISGAANNPVIAAASLVRYKTSVAQTYIQRVLGLAPSTLIGYWPLNETAGSIATDVSSNGRHGTYNGVTLNTTTAPDGSVAGLWDGINDYVSLPSFNIHSASFSYGVWFKPSSSPPSAQAIIACEGIGATHRTANLLVGSSGIAEMNYWTDSTASAAGAIGFSGTWYYLVGTYDAGTDTSKLYVNGVLLASNSAGPYEGGTTPIFNVGCTIPSFGQAKGNIAHVAIWNTALSPAQVQYLAQI